MMKRSLEILMGGQMCSPFVHALTPAFIHTTLRTRHSGKILWMAALGSEVITGLPPGVVIRGLTQDLADNFVEWTGEKKAVRM